MQFRTLVECPRCDYCMRDDFEFDDGEFDLEGSPIKQFEMQCFECNAKFWVDAYVRFEVEIDSYHTKKPRPPHD